MRTHSIVHVSPSFFTFITLNQFIIKKYFITSYLFNILKIIILLSTIGQTYGILTVYLLQSCILFGTKEVHYKVVFFLEQKEYIAIHERECYLYLECNG